MGKYDEIVFDELKFIVTKDSESLTLNPLSFRLLLALAQGDGNIVSINSLLGAVWPQNNVSPETLKQRVFVLRKSLEQSTITGLTIQAVRGEGYRLLIEASSEKLPEISETEKPKKTSLNPTSLHNNKSFSAISGLALTMIALIIYMALPHSADKATNNNRIALWSNMPPAEMTESAKSVYTTWDHMLSQASETQVLQLVLSNQRPDLPLPIQARKDRVALISYFEVISVNNETTIKLNIVEPTTATILRSNMVMVSSNSSLTQILESQLDGIESLVSSGKLYLNKQQRDYANDPIWPELKALANSS